MNRRLKLALLALPTAFACTEPTLTGTGAPPTNAEVFDALWNEFDLRYSFFEVKRVNWDSMRVVHRPRAIAAENDAALARVLGAMITALQDRHVFLTTAGSTPAMTLLSKVDTVLPRNPFDAQLIDRQYLQAKRATQGGHIQFGFVTPTIGYVRIPQFDGSGWAGELDEALAALAGAQSMIVDVRGNRGGSHTTAIAAAGRFASSSSIYSYTKMRNGPAHSDFTAMTPQVVHPAGPAQFRGPVVVLTNRVVYSSAEDFVLAMDALPNVTTMGDSTGGASGRPLTRELPNGWTYTLSTWVEYTRDRRIFENIGLAPDVYVPTNYAELSRGVDAVMDRAIAMVKKP
jgi:carboxyl-terminal processing protease